MGRYETATTLVFGMQVTFADAASTAKSITFAHGKSPGVWEKLGSMPLKSHGSSCLQHVIKLGAHTQVQRYLRITLQGLLHPLRDSGSYHGTVYFPFIKPLIPLSSPCTTATAACLFMVKQYDLAWPKACSMPSGWARTHKCITTCETLCRGCCILPETATAFTVQCPISIQRPCRGAMAECLLMLTQHHLACEQFSSMPSSFQRHYGPQLR